MNKTAYLVAYVDIKTLKVVGASVHSEPALSLTQAGVPEVALDVYSFTGRDFDQAQRELLEFIRSERHFRWIVPLLPRSL